MSRAGILNFKPTKEQREQVQMLAAIGIPHEHIAMTVKNGDVAISVDTLTRHFPDELSAGLSMALGMVGGKLFATALGRNAKATVADELRAQMFIFNTRGGWATHSKVETETEEDEVDETAVAARIAGLIEKGLRVKGKPPTVQ